MLRSLDTLGEAKGKGETSDPMGGLIVALDVIHRREAADGKAAKWGKRVLLVTDFMGDVDTALVQVVEKTCLDKGVRVEVVAIGVTEDEKTGELECDDPVRLERAKTMAALATATGGFLVAHLTALSSLGALRVKQVQTRPSFQGEFEIGEDVRIKVRGFLATRGATLPSLKKASRQALADAQATGEDEGASARVQMMRTYALAGDPDREVEDAERIRGYRYGRQNIPISAAAEEELKAALASTRSLVLLGFTDAANIPRHLFMGQVTAFCALEGLVADETALAALALGLSETDRVAIVRYTTVARAAPQLGVMWPGIDAEKTVLYYCKLPFSEDVRSFFFKPLPAVDARQRAAARAVIEAMDLSRPEEAVVPEQTYNPAIHHFYQCLVARALDPRAPLPEIDQRIARAVQPDPALLVSAKGALNGFAAEFVLTPVERSKDGHAKRQQVWGADAAAAGGAAEVLEPAAKRQKVDITDLPSEVAKAKADLGPDGAAAVPTALSSDHPIRDFDALVKRRDGDYVDVAIGLMRRFVTTLIEVGIRQQNHPQIVECMKALRERCAQEEEAEQFDAFLSLIKDQYALVYPDVITLLRDSAIHPLDPARAATFYTQPAQQQVKQEPGQATKKRPRDDEFE
jgi:ATP-dependent DNA helicase 2 subunit 2